HVAIRGWSTYFKTVDGYPSTKSGVIAKILQEGGFVPSRVAVIGDGISDEEAARVNGCTFFAIGSPADLAAVGQALGASDV
ncbi:MAG: HAD family hydrolase, partial [Burkholderiales bacterium]